MKITSEVFKYFYEEKFMDQKFNDFAYEKQLEKPTITIKPRKESFANHYAQHLAEDFDRFKSDKTFNKEHFIADMLNAYEWARDNKHQLESNPNNLIIGFDNLIEQVEGFCEEIGINKKQLNAFYKIRKNEKNNYKDNIESIDDNGDIEMGGDVKDTYKEEVDRARDRKSKIAENNTIYLKKLQEGSDYRASVEFNLNSDFENCNTIAKMANNETSYIKNNIIRFNGNFLSGTQEESNAKFANWEKGKYTQLKHYAALKRAQEQKPWWKRFFFAKQNKKDKEALSNLRNSLISEMGLSEKYIDTAVKLMNDPPEDINNYVSISMDGKVVKKNDPQPNVEQSNNEIKIDNKNVDLGKKQEELNQNLINDTTKTNTEVKSEVKEQTQNINKKIEKVND